MYEILRNVRVVEVASYVFVPVAGAILADWGASVVRVEHPVTGDPYRALRNDFVRPGLPNPMLELPNRGKRSVGLDISTPRGLEILYELVKDADVFITSFMGKSLEKLGIDYESIKDINPRIVYARGSGYGPKGPLKDKPGFDASATWARGGLLYRLSMPDDDAAAPIPGSVGDLTGGLAVAMGVAAALYARERTGEAPEVDVSLYHIGMWIMSQSVGAATLGIGGPPDPAERLKKINPLSNTYRTKDGRWIYLCMLQPDPHWADFCRHIGRTDLIDDPRFVDIDARAEHATELIGVLDVVFVGRTLAEWQESLATMTGVWDPALAPLEIVEDPQVTANGYLAEVEAHDGSTFKSVAAPVQFGGVDVGRVRAMPEHAQHTEEVLLEFGHSWDDIAELKASGVIV